jgi:L-cysteate sulfo-lyase
VLLQLGRFPRVRLGHLPTPLEPMTRLSDLLGGPRLWIKRDDCTGLAFGGNKTRKLEYLVADALRQDVDTLITLGATQSNHARQTAAAAAKFGLKCVLILEERIPEPDDTYRHNGNVLLDRLLGATLKFVPRDSSMTAAAELAADEVRRAGGRPFVIPGGGSNAVGALGYVGCALEVLQQAAELGIRIDRVVHATGSSGTQAGLIAGFDGAQSGVRVLGITVGRLRDNQERNVGRLLDETWEHLGMKGAPPQGNIEANDSYFGEAYGVPTPAMKEAVRLLAETESVLLDPVYSGKAMSGLIDLVRKDTFGRDENIVFVHTGGQAGLFAYEPTFAA